MKVVLLDSMDNLGALGEIVKVKAGYARNFLLPRGKAMPANEKNLKHVAHQKMILDHKIKRARTKSEEVLKMLEAKGIVIRRKAGENEKLFGSVTAIDVEAALRAEGVLINRRAIHLEEPIKKLGKFRVPIRLDGGLEAKLNVEVAAEKS